EKNSKDKLARNKPILAKRGPNRPLFKFMQFGLAVGSTVAGPADASPAVRPSRPRPTRGGLSPVEQTETARPRSSRGKRGSRGNHDRGGVAGEHGPGPDAGVPLRQAAHRPGLAGVAGVPPGGGGRTGAAADQRPEAAAVRLRLLPADRR